MYPGTCNWGPLFILLQFIEIDLINLENACEYFAVKLLLVVGQIPPLDFIWCFKVFLWNSNILPSYIKCSDVWAPSLQGHIRLSINLSLWRYDFVFPWSETIAVNSDVIGIFSFSLCSSVGKNDLHSAPLLVVSHCLCHFVSPSFFSSVAVIFIGILFYTMFGSLSSSAASLASLSASSFPSFPFCAFTHPKWVQVWCDWQEVTNNMGQIN